ncbi:hypothetical protein Glove_307g46 [Diversispora epigaea]|uniref:Uncharacterized protein n=1 Tax=Diversispora epigaea TaxID=1348612 RepID=A0A397HTE1_9GLOM|nr:hypothetical protein Glove_307g46 [Diversispora epigaea]
MNEKIEIQNITILWEIGWISGIALQNIIPSRRVEISDLDNASNVANETQEVETLLLRNSAISPEINPGHNNSSNLSSNLTNITRSNISLPCNESDISMQDVGGSQPLSYMESINEEER